MKGLTPTLQTTKNKKSSWPIGSEDEVKELHRKGIRSDSKMITRGDQIKSQCYETACQKPRDSLVRTQFVSDPVKLESILKKQSHVSSLSSQYKLKGLFY